MYANNLWFVYCKEVNVVSMNKKTVWNSYRFPILLMTGVVIGCIIGVVFGSKATVLKPLGDIFLNLIFCIVVPVVFFSISSAVSSMNNMKRLGKILGYMMLVFIITGFIGSAMMYIMCQINPPAQGIQPIFQDTEAAETMTVGEQIVNSLTVSDFSMLLSRKNMLPLIIFSIFFGFVVGNMKEKMEGVSKALNTMSTLFMKMVDYIMLYAPIGLGAYFAALIGDVGPQLLGTYARTLFTVYLPVVILYLIIAWPAYAYFAGGMQGIKTFFKNAVNPAVTSLATQSSIATLPVNMEATRKMGVPKDIVDIVLPIGATLHMDGACISAIMKIALLFGLFGRPYTGFSTWAISTLVAIVGGMVMSGVPGGGMLGEMLIMNVFGFPMEAFPVIATIGFLIDAPGTMLNATGDGLAAMMVTRLVEGKNWMKNKFSLAEDNVQA